MNPLIRHELLDVLRTRKTVALQLGLGLGCAVLVLLRWPTDAIADHDGTRALEVLRVFSYGLLAGILLLVPALPAATLVREKVQGTLALLLNSPMRASSIYLGKLLGVLGFAGVLLMMSLPAAAACHALGGTVVRTGILQLYAVLGMTVLELATLGLLVSSRSHSTDGALRVTYGLVLVICVLTLGPHMLLRGQADRLATLASWLRFLSPLPAVMEVLGQGDIGTFGMIERLGAVPRYLLMAGGFSLVCALTTVAGLDLGLLDRARAAGVMTEDRSLGGKVLRRLLFLVDPQRRSRGISLWVNPVLIKEFRARRFGRSHWLIRLIFVSAILSLILSYIAATGALGWGLDVIGGALVLLQVALLILFAPSVAGGLISGERESGSWLLLRMTPLSAGAIVRGKLLSVAWPLLLVLSATLPGYLVISALEPTWVYRVSRVIACLALTAVFAVLLSAAISTLFRSTATATTVSYLALLTVCVGPLLVWLAREAPFAQATVQSVLMINPVAAALQASATPGLAQYELLPANWWIIGSACVLLLGVLSARTWQLCRPE
jgi:ABC-type transport system involved in multi-copper enzyme maturation permease subunit